MTKKLANGMLTKALITAAVLAAPVIMGGTAAPAAPGYQYQYLMSVMSDKCYSVDATDTSEIHELCYDAAFGSGGVQNCLGGGANLTFQGRKFGCWLPNNRAFPKSPTAISFTSAERGAMAGCLQRRQSVMARDGKITCVVTPAEVVQKMAAEGGNNAPLAARLPAPTENCYNPPCPLQPNQWPSAGIPGGGTAAGNPTSPQGPANNLPAGSGNNAPLTTRLPAPTENCYNPPCPLQPNQWPSSSARIPAGGPAAGSPTGPQGPANNLPGRK